MAAGRYNFKVEQGSTVDFTINYTDASGTPVDLTDYGARMDIRPEAGSDTLYATLSSSLAGDLTGIDMTPPNPDGSGNLTKADGSLRVYISAASSSAFDFKSAQYDLEIYSGSAPVTVNKILTGRISLTKEITTSS